MENRKEYTFPDCDNRENETDRREGWGQLSKYVKWNHFTWIAGGLIAAGVFVNSFMWQQAEENHRDALNSIHQNELKIVSHSRHLDIIDSELAHFADSRKYLMDTYRRDMDRMQKTLDKLDDHLSVMIVKISKLEEPGSDERKK